MSAAPMSCSAERWFRQPSVTAAGTYEGLSSSIFSRYLGPPTTGPGSCQYVVAGTLSSPYRVDVADVDSADNVGVGVWISRNTRALRRRQPLPSAGRAAPKGSFRMVHDQGASNLTSRLRPRPK